MPAENTTPNVAFDVPVESLQTPPQGALDAMNAVLADMKPADAPAADAPPADAPPADTPPADAPPADTPPADAPPVDAPPVDAPPADTPPADTPAPRPSDEFGELPKDVRAETRERFEVMRTRYDALHEREQRATTAAETWHQTVASTGATPEQFGATLAILRDVNSGTPEGLERAYDAISQQQAALAKLLGKPGHGYDPLDDHPDLKARVADSVDFTRDDALLIIQARNAGKLQETVRTRESTQNDLAAAHQAGIGAVEALGNALRARDGATFQAKLPALTAIIETVVSSLPPDQWAGRIQAAYDKIPAPMTTPAAATPAAPNPIRPGASGSANVNKTPTNALEAMQMALARGG